MQVFMRMNQPNAQWELSPYPKAAAIVALGNSYDLRFVNDDGTEEIREKTPLAATPQPTLLQASPNMPLAFEAWWTTNGAAYGEENKSTVREVFFAGYTARR